MGHMSGSTNLSYKMKVLALFLLVAVASSHALPAHLPDAIQYGIVDTVKDAVNGMLESGVKLGEKIGEMLSKVKDLMDKLKEWYEKAAKGKNIDEVLKVLHQKMVDEIENVLHIIFDKIASVVLKVVDYINSMVSGYPMEAMIKQAMHSMLVQAFEKYNDVMQSDDWDAFVDDVIVEVRDNLDEKLDDFSTQ